MSVDVSGFWKAVGEVEASCPSEKLEEIVKWIDETAKGRDARVVKMYYGLGEEQKTTVQIAQEFEVTSDCIRRNRERAMRMLRKSHKQRIKLWRHKIRANKKEVN